MKKPLRKKTGDAVDDRSRTGKLGFFLRRTTFTFEENHQELTCSVGFVLDNLRVNGKKS